MAAFCNCCGSEITLKTEACALCGMPRHGMGSSAAKVTLKTSARRSAEGLAEAPANPGAESRSAGHAFCFVGC